MSQDENIIERAMMELVHHEPFYANLILNMKRYYDYNIPTIGVNVTETVNLYVNPHFWAGLSLEAQVDILKHECHHVINNHFVRFNELEPQALKKIKLLNIEIYTLNTPSSYLKYTTIIS